MIEVYKLPTYKEQDFKQLNHVLPWWEKELNKYIKKNKNWMRKFKINPDDHIPFNNIEEVTYSKAFKSINNYLNFATPKIEQIKSDAKLMKKFGKMITDYMTLLGFLHGILLIIEFYNDLDKEPIADRKKHILKMANTKNLFFFNRYKTEIYKIYPEHKILNDIFNSLVEKEDYLLEFKVFVIAITKYFTKLKKTKEISQEQIMQIVYLSYLIISFNQSYNYLVKTLLYRI
ncbi:hypothetical protein [Mesoplasma photuris]|uniref:hypothetical protein n=1 Tax=Mesoplasma photuris TaxID=217731 RepID=UPI0004E20E0C|nr:hypothetical protein [Mesoplasma photuris]